MNTLEVFRWLLARIEEREPAGLWTVVEHEGSSPGRAGFLMGVSAGATVGTVGGGIMEAQLADEGRQRLSQKTGDVALAARVHREQAPAETRSGLICSGAQRLAFCPLGSAQRPVLSEIVNGLEAGKAVRLSISGQGIAAQVQSTLPSEQAPEFLDEGTDFRFRAWIGPRHTIYVFGSGHVGQALCRSLALLDFHIVAFDNRPDLEQVRENHFAHELITGPYDEVRGRVAAGCRSYGVVVTAQRDHDIEVLKQVADLPFRYLGVMGSRAKLTAIRSALADGGVDPADIARIRSPVGLSIGAETPAEIAASIAAELVAVRRGQDTSH